MTIRSRSELNPTAMLIETISNLNSHLYKRKVSSVIFFQVLDSTAACHCRSAHAELVHPVRVSHGLRLKAHSFPLRLALQHILLACCVSSVDRVHYSSNRALPLTETVEELFCACGSVGREIEVPQGAPQQQALQPLCLS